MSVSEGEATNPKRSVRRCFYIEATTMGEAVFEADD
jgi:hypothetical protein